MVNQLLKYRLLSQKDLDKSYRKPIKKLKKSLNFTTGY